MEKAQKRLQVTNYLNTGFCKLASTPPLIRATTLGVCFGTPLKIVEYQT
jgi:hypothetical protein